MQKVFHNAFWTNIINASMAKTLITDKRKSEVKMPDFLVCILYAVTAITIVLLSMKLGKNHISIIVNERLQYN